MACDGVVEKPRAEEQQNESVDLQLRFLGERTNERTLAHAAARVVPNLARSEGRGIWRSEGREQ